MFPIPQSDNWKHQTSQLLSQVRFFGCSWLTNDLMIRISASLLWELEASAAVLSSNQSFTSILTPCYAFEQLLKRLNPFLVLWTLNYVLGTISGLFPTFGAHFWPVRHFFWTLLKILERLVQPFGRIADLWGVFLASWTLFLDAFKDFRMLSPTFWTHCQPYGRQ